MNKTRKTARIRLQLTTWVVICLFSCNNLGWADPNVFLQPPLYTLCANDSDRIEVALAVFLRSLDRPIDKIDLHLFPIIRDKQVHLFFDSPNKRREGDKWIVPAQVEGMLREAVIDVDLNITLRDVQTAANPSQATPPDLSSYTSLIADTERLAAVEAVFSDLDGVDKAQNERSVPKEIRAAKERLSREGVRLGTVSGRPSGELITIFGGIGNLTGLSTTFPYMLIGSTGGEGLSIKPDSTTAVIDILANGEGLDEASKGLLKTIAGNAVIIASHEAGFSDEIIKSAQFSFSPKSLSVRTLVDPRINTLRHRIAELIRQALSKLPETSPLKNLNVLISAGAVDITISNKGDAAIRMIKLHKLKSVVLAADSVGTALEPGNDRSMLALTPEILKAAGIDWPVDLIKIYVGKEEKVEIPEGVIIAPQGNKETDPALALYGAIAAAKEKKRSSLDPANIDVMSWAGHLRPINELTWNDREEVELYFRGLSGKFHLHLRPTKWPDAERLKVLADERTPSEYYKSLSDSLNVLNSKDFSTDVVKFMHVFFDMRIPGAVWFDQISQAEDIAQYVDSLLEKDPARIVKIFDYGTANGEEALSLAVILNNRFREKYPSARIIIIGRDLQAPDVKMQNWIDPAILPDEIAPHTDRYFVRIGDTLVPKPETLAMVRLSAGNIIEIANDTPAGDLPADVVIINNVLGAYVKKNVGLERAVEAISGSLAPGGRLYANNSLYRDPRHWYDCLNALKNLSESPGGLRLLTNEIFEKIGPSAAESSPTQPGLSEETAGPSDSSPFLPTTGTLALSEELSRKGSLSIRLSGETYTFELENMPFWGAGRADSFEIRVLTGGVKIGLIDVATSTISYAFDSTDAPALFVETNYRGKGIGRALLALAMGVSRNKGYNQFHVMKATPAGGEGDMYLNMGFARINRNRFGNDYRFDLTNPLPTVWSKKRSTPQNPPKKLPDGSPWYIAVLLKDTFNNERVDIETIKQTTTGRKDGMLSEDTIERDLGTLVFLDLVEWIGVGQRKHFFRMVDLTILQWDSIDPILKGLGDRPTKEQKANAKKLISDILTPPNIRTFEARIEPDLRRIGISLWQFIAEPVNRASGMEIDTRLALINRLLEILPDGRIGNQAIISSINQGRELMAAIQAGNHKRPAQTRQEAMRRLMARISHLLDVAQKDCVVVNVIGRSGVGKTTVSNYIKNASSEVSPDEVLIIQADQLHNDVGLVNSIIAARHLLNIPIRDLDPSDEIEQVLSLAHKLSMPIDMMSSKTFLDHYKHFMEEFADTGTTTVFYEKSILAKVDQRIINTPLCTLPEVERAQVIDLTKKLGIPEAVVASYITPEQGRERLSFNEIYNIERDKRFIKTVESDGTPSRTTPLKIILTEGTFSYQGREIFDTNATRIRSDINVFVEVPDEKTRRSRILHRGRHVLEEELKLFDLYDVIYASTLDKERENADVILDNSTETNDYQVVTTASGAKIQFGVSSETAKDMIQDQVGSDVFVLPPELFKLGKNFADIEFPLYYKFFFQKGKKTVIVGTSEQCASLKKFLQYSLLGPPDFSKYADTSRSELLLATARDRYAIKNVDGSIAPFEKFVSFIEFDPSGKATIQLNGKDVSILTKGQNKFSVEEDGSAEKEVAVDYRAPQKRMSSPDKISRYCQSLTEATARDFAVTPLGTSHGFDPQGDHTSFIIWLDAKGIIVDPSPSALSYLNMLGVDSDKVPYILLTHTHGDHDGGVLKLILSSSKKKLIASRPVYDSFIEKTRALVGDRYKIEDWVEWIELKAGAEGATELVLSEPWEKDKVSAVITARFNLHSIPTNGFKITFAGSSFGYSADTQYDPVVTNKLLQEDKITPEQANDLLYFFWDKNGTPLVDAFYHEAGIPPIHTPTETLKTLSSDTRERMKIVHVSAKDAKKAALPQPEPFITEALPGAKETRVSRSMIACDAIRQFLKKTLSGVGATEEALNEIANKLTENGCFVSASKGDEIIRVNDPIDDSSCVFFLLDGKIDIVQGGNKLSGAMVSMTPKNVFGEMALTKDGKARSASVIASSPAVKLFSLSKSLINSVVREKLGIDFTDASYLSREGVENIIFAEMLAEKFKNAILGDENASPLDRSGILWLAHKLKKRYVVAGHPVPNVKEGDVADSFFLVHSGKLGVFRDTAAKGVTSNMPPADKDIILGYENDWGGYIATLHSHDYFGEMALISPDGLRQASVVALKDSQVLSLSKQDFDELLKRYPTLSFLFTYVEKVRARELKDKRERTSAFTKVHKPAGTRQISERLKAITRKQVRGRDTSDTFIRIKEHVSVLVKAMIQDLRSGTKDDPVSHIAQEIVETEEKVSGWVDIFRLGKYTIHRTKSGYDIANSINYGETMAIGNLWTVFSYDKALTETDKSKIYQAWKIWERDFVSFPREGDPAMAQRVFDREFGEYNIKAVNATTAAEIYYIMELLKLLPQRVLRSGMIRQINFKASRGSYRQSAGAAVYDPATKEVGILGNNARRFDRQMLTGFILHEFGHALYQTISPAEKAAFDNIYGKFLADKEAVIKPEFMVDLWGKERAVYGSPDEFFAENFMYSILLGKEGMIDSSEKRYQSLRQEAYSFFTSLSEKPGLSSRRTSTVSKVKIAPPGSPYAVFELMLDEQGENEEPVIFNKGHLAESLGRKTFTLEPDLRALERLGLVMSNKDGSSKENVYRLNIQRWRSKNDGPSLILEKLNRYGYRIPDSEMISLSSEIRAALGETISEFDEELVAAISSKKNPTSAYLSRLRRIVEYIWNNEGWASRQDLAGNLGCDIGTIGDDLKTVSLSKLKEASLARGMPVPVFFDKKIQREKWQRIVAIAESRLWCVSLDELGRALGLSTSGNFTVKRVFSPCVDRKDVEVLLRDINHNRRLRPQIKDRFSIEVIFSKEEKELRDKVITGLEALGGITTTRELSNLIGSGDRSVSSAVKKLDFRNINCKRAAMGMTPVIAPVDPRTIRSLNEIIYAMESLGGVATAAQLAKYTGQPQSYTTRLVSEMKENGIFTYLNAIRKQQNKFPLLIAREYPFDINGLVYVRSVLTNSGFYRADGTSSDSLALYKSFFGATGLDIFRDIVLPLTSRTITTNTPSSGTGNRTNDELLRSKLLDDIIAIAIIYARDKGLGEAGTKLRGAVRRNERLINFLKFAVPRAINTSGHSFVAYTNDGPPISTTKGYYSSLSSQTNKVPLLEFIKNLDLAYLQTENPLKHAFSRDEELIRERNLDRARASYIELGERDARMFESGRVLPRTEDEGSLIVKKVPPDGSPWKIASLLRDDFRRSGATPAQIASGTKGRGDDGHLTAETILRDLNTLISFNLVTREESAAGTLYRFTKLSDGEWGAIEPILMRLGDRPTSAMKDAAKANIKLSVQRLGKKDDADPELSPLGGSPEKITDVTPLIKRIEEEVKTGRRVIVLVDGDPGTGKTSIIAAGIRQRFSRSRVISLDRYVRDDVRNGLHTQYLYADLTQAIGSLDVVVFEGPNLQFAINAMRDLYAFFSDDFIGDNFINTVPICVRASSESDSSRRFFVHRSSENEKVKNNRLDCRQRLGLQYGYDFHFVRPAGGNPALEPRPRMGKRAKVKHIDAHHNTAFVDSPADGTTRLALVPRGDMPITSLIDYLTSMDNIAQEHKDIIIEMLNIMNTLPVKLLTFEELIADLHGFASPKNGLIAIHNSLAGMPAVQIHDETADQDTARLTRQHTGWIFDDRSAITFIHEIGEYLAAAGTISLSLNADVLVITMNGHDRSIKLGDKAPEALTIAKKDPAAVHYLLRAGCREIFGQRDADLTKEIKKWSRYSPSASTDEEGLLPTDWADDQRNIPATDKLTVSLNTHIGRITVLKEDGTSKRAVELRVVKASDLTDEGRNRASRSLTNWTDQQDPAVTYPKAVETFIRWLNNNDKPQLSKLLFVLSEEGEDSNIERFIEGWVDLSNKKICLMEIAPWNRTQHGEHSDVIEKRLYKGMGGQLRAFALKILIRVYGKDLFSPRHITKVIMLGERGRQHNNLFVTADKDTVIAYIKRKDEEVRRLKRQLNAKNQHAEPERTDGFDDRTMPAQDHAGSSHDALEQRTDTAGMAVYNEKWTLSRSSRGGIDAKIRLFSGETVKVEASALITEEGITIQYQNRNKDRLPGQTDILRRLFARAHEIATTSYMYPKWAFVYVISGPSMNSPDMEVLSRLMADLGFASRDELSSENPEFKIDDDLTAIINRTMPPGIMTAQDQYWAMPVETLLDISVKKQDSREYRPDGVEPVIDGSGGADNVALTGKTVPPDNDPTAPADTKYSPAGKENPLALRDLRNKQSMAECLAEEILSMTINKKVILAFDNSLAGGRAGSPLSIFEELKSLKDDKIFGEALNNLEIVIAPASELSAKINERISGDTKVFLFAPRASEKTLGSLETITLSSYIEEEGFANNAYYPLAEIVAITLAQLSDNRETLRAILNKIVTRGGTISLADLNIESLTIDKKALIFKLLPNAAPRTTQELIRHYATIKRFLKAA